VSAITDASPGANCDDGSTSQLERPMSTEIPAASHDPGMATRVQILATEHWSLLATRSLTYTESLGRVNIFLAILSGAVIALALVAQADRFGTTFIAVAIPLLGVALFAGIATISRLMALNRDDYRWVVGMNRLRHGYVGLYPELEQYFTASPYDDLPGALQTLGIDDLSAGTRLGSMLHLFQTLPGMLTVIVGCLGGAIGALAAIAVAIPPLGAVVTAAAAFLVVVASLQLWGRRSVTTVPPSLQPRFPSPGR
jgi:hypothetical protein